MSRPAPATTAEQATGSRLILMALLLAAVACKLNIAAASIALPEIGAEFEAPQSILNLVAVGAGLGLAMSVLYFGAVADRYGRKQLLLVGLVLLIVAGVFSALAPSVELLIAARVFTGIAAGMVFPTTLSLITTLWAEGPGRTGAIALWAAVGGMASVAGAVVAGLILSVLPWSAVFLISAPIAVIAIAIVLPTVPSHVHESTKPVDHVGGVLSTLGIGALVLGISFALAPDSAVLGIALLVGAVVLITLFLLRQRRAANPLYDLGVAKSRMFWAPATGGLIALGALTGATFVGAQFMQNTLEYSPLQAGTAVLPAAVGLVIAAPFVARILTARGTRTTMLAGYALLAASYLTMLLWREDTQYWLIGIGFLLLGAGASFVSTSASHALTSATPADRVGMASGTTDLQSDLGGSIMQALLGAALATGFATAITGFVSQSSRAAEVTADMSAALQSSFASAAHVAAQNPDVADGIMEAARLSLVHGALAAYLIGAVAIAIGVVVVRFGVPSSDAERSLAAR